MKKNRELDKHCATGEKHSSRQGDQPLQPPQGALCHLKLLWPMCVDEVEVPKTFKLLQVHLSVRVLVRGPHQGLEDRPGRNCKNGRSKCDFIMFTTESDLGKVLSRGER